MRHKDIVIGESYRLKSLNGKPLTIAWAKVVGVLPAKTGWNTTNKWVAKCKWTQEKNGTVGVIKYFAVSNLCYE